jgi:hypothetical protein
VSLSIFPLLLSLAATPDGSPASPSPGQALAARAFHMADVERVHALAALPRPEREAFFRSLTVAEIVALGRKSLNWLGIYQARVTRVERVQDRLHGPDTVEVTVREHPLAVRLEFVTGTHKGRRALYNAELRPAEMLARESGVLGLVSVWLALDSRLTRRFSNHNITEVGFGAMMDTVQVEQARAAAVGGYGRTDEGFDAHGLFCMFFTAPSAAKGLYTRRLRYCVEGGLGLPMKIEVFDDNGRREYVEYENLRVRQALRDDFFTPKAAGL